MSYICFALFKKSSYSGVIKISLYINFSPKNCFFTIRSFNSSELMYLAAITIDGDPILSFSV